jgi:tRNA threonylcarbamoyladenosine biosynthesis protein TsaE
MNTDMIWQVTTTSANETEQLAADIGARLRGGEIIELASDLGGGKTTFVRGLARGAGSAQAVGSPSFTISREYQADKFTIHHYDFYRLSEPGIMAEELRETLSDPNAVAVVEWADTVQHVLPAERVTVNIASPSENERQLIINLPQRRQYLRGES